MDAYGLVSARATQIERPESDCNAVRHSARQLLSSVWADAAEELVRLVCAMGIDPGRADDVLQDVYLTAWRKSPLGVDGVGLKRWLLRVVINRCNLEHRRHARWRNVWHGLRRLWSESPDRADPARAASQGEQRWLVRRGLDRLAPDLREVLVLRYFAGLDSKEIGRVLELPDGTVRSRLRTARQRLAEELKRAGYDHEQ